MEGEGFSHETGKGRKREEAGAAAAGVGRRGGHGRRGEARRSARGHPQRREALHPCHWTIDTKYYTANVYIWIYDLKEREVEDSLRALSERSEALILVFDLNDFTSFETMQNWCSKIKLQKFEILLCVGNKADRVPNHYGHSEYRRKLQKRWESFSENHPEFWDYGIQQSEGAQLLNDCESCDVRRKSCIDWCLDHGIEYIEACAIDEDFDNCISVDGDSQGITRIFGALSAHMWPGMIMKPKRPVSENSVISFEELSSDESEFSVEYELLSNGSAEPEGGDEGPWSFAIEDVMVDECVSCDLQDEHRSSMIVQLEGETEEVKQHIHVSSSSSDATKPEVERHEKFIEPHTHIHSPSVSFSVKSEDKEHDQDDLARSSTEAQNMMETYDRYYDAGDTEENTSIRKVNGQESSVDSIELLMHKMSLMRDNLQFMPDSYRREMAASLAMQMAHLFTDVDGSDTD